MIAVLLKDLDRQKILISVFVGMIVLLTLSAGQGREWMYLLGSVLLLLALSISATLVPERIEDQFHGYVILKSLPLGVSKIVGAKFILQMLVAFVSSSAVSLLMSIAFGDAALIRFGLVLFAWTFCVSLVLISLSYIGVYALGMTRFTTVAKITSVTLLLIPQIILFFLLKTRRMPNFSVLRDTIGMSSVLIPLGLAVTLYAVGYVIAVKIRRTR